MQDFKYDRKPIEGFLGYYIDTKGVVSSYLKDGGGFFKKPHLIKIIKNNCGYLRVGLYKEGKQIRKYLHRLLAIAFIPKQNKKPLVLHKDGNKLHNCVFIGNCGCGGNLRWGNGSENSFDSIRHGTHIDNSGEKHGMVKLNEGEVKKIKKLLTLGFTQGNIARKFGVSIGCIGHIKHLRTWKHLLET